MSQQTPPAIDFPNWLEAASKWILIGSIVTVGLIALFIALGFTNPPMQGDLRIDVEKVDGWTSLTSKDDTNSLSASPDDQRAYLIAPYIVTPPATVEITAQQPGGDRVAGYGLWWGDPPPASHALFGVSGNVYLGIYLSADGEDDAIRHYARYPHVLQSGEANRFRIDVADSVALLRLNSEVVQEVSWRTDAPFRLGLFAETIFGAQSAEAEIITVKIWSAHPVETSP